MSLPADPADFAALDEAGLQAVLGGALQDYARRRADGAAFPPFAQDAEITATDAMITTTAILKAVNVQLFELSLWQSWSGANT
jgi:hypothetical protein